ncbi:MAG: DUF6788 family protein [Bacteroidota bacterium]
MGVVRPQWVRCGKANCRCASGQREDLHGPYYYRFFRENGRLRKMYVPKAQLEAIQEGCARRQLEERAFRSRRDAARRELRRLNQALESYQDDYA